MNLLVAMLLGILAVFALVALIAFLSFVVPLLPDSPWIGLVGIGAFLGLVLWSTTNT